jgi:hypothetical protein
VLSSGPRPANESGGPAPGTSGRKEDRDHRPLDFSSTELLADLYPAYIQLREHRPVHHKWHGYGRLAGATAYLMTRLPEPARLLELEKLP